MEKYLIKDSSRSSSSSSSHSKDQKKETKVVPTSQLLAEAGPIFILGTFQGHTKMKITRMIESAGGSCSDDIEDDQIRYSIISPAIWALESTKGANRVLRSLKDANEANESHLKALHKKWDKKTKKGEESEEEEEVEDEEEDDGERDFDKYVSNFIIFVLHYTVLLRCSMLRVVYSTDISIGITENLDLSFRLALRLY